MSQNNAAEGRGSSAKNSLDMKTLFVRSIPFEATDEELANYFSELAPIKHAVIVKDNEKNSRGFGFVSFAVEDDTKDALEKARKTKFKGRLLRVDIAKRRERSKGDQRSSSSSEQAGNVENKENELMGGKPKLIIRNMPWSVRKPEQLKQIFMRFGTVVEAKIPKKPDGKLCGFAFVTMKKLAACKKAIEDSKDLKIDGRQVAVDFAIQKNKWEDYKKENVAEKVESESESESEIDEQEAGEEGSSNEASEAEDEDNENGSEDEDSDANSEEDVDEKVTRS